ncbi:hypothetical protein LPU83_pLPU83c_0783 (plasmid) [Rhizobium favelukesii]|uniref:Uncharacterized protein n=1 Tax=Rhizobium favelukesii TaxID=348824 RepID=W6RM85_9HYPH|nr:hypothetical protein LPU83_pLPU83c_0783 [Rhizobium favelukesii]
MAVGWGENSSRQVEAGSGKIGLHLILELDAEALAFLQEHLVAIPSTQLLPEPDCVAVVLDIFGPPVCNMGIGTEVWAAHEKSRQSIAKAVEA